MAHYLKGVTHGYTENVRMHDVQDCVITNIWLMTDVYDLSVNTESRGEQEPRESV